MTRTNDTLTAVPGIKVGHYTDLKAVTGCTVVRCPPGTVGGVDVRGGAPGTRETDLLQAHNLVAEVTAVALSGGSAFGLATADGVMRWHVERGLGYQSRSGVIVPIVPAAILFDLTIGDQRRRARMPMPVIKLARRPRQNRSAWAASARAQAPGLPPY